MLFQIIFTLLTYQYSFDFTHNDLHTNNIMYTSIKEHFLWYKYDDEYYKVPPYGLIFKIIDFGRNIYKYKSKLFSSGNFNTLGDASSQYNCEPYFNDKKPRLDPNYSFDLCRLACSIYDLIIDEDTDMNNLNDFQKIIHL